MGHNYPGARVALESHLLVQTTSRPLSGSRCGDTSWDVRHPGRRHLVGWTANVVDREGKF